MIRRSVISAAFSLMLAPAALASSDVGQCEHWSVGGETPYGTEIFISRLIEINTTIQHPGTTFVDDLGDHGSGVIQFDDFDQHKPRKVAPSVFVAVIDANANYISFTTAAGSYAQINLNDGGNERVKTGRLIDPTTGKNKVVRDLKEPVSCTRVKGKRHLVSIFDEAVLDRDSLTFLGSPNPNDVFFVGKEYLVRDEDADGGLASVFAADAGEATEAVDDEFMLSKAVAPETVDVLSEPEGGLSGLAKNVDASRNTVAAIAADIGAAPVKRPKMPNSPDALVSPNNSVCMLASSRVLNTDLNLSSEKIYAAGLVRMDVPLHSFTYEPLVDTLLNDVDQYAIVEGEREVLTSISLNGLKRYDVPGVTKEPVVPVSLLDAQVVSKSLAEAAPIPDENRLQIAVLGDAASVKAAGLHRVEDAAAAKLGQKFWRVSWYDVAPDGTIRPAQNFASLTELHESLPADGAPVFLSSGPDFNRFMTGMEELVINAPQTIDQLYWVKEGYLLPHSAPSRISTAFQRINETGNIARRANGKPLKWLQIIAGSYAQPFSQYYLDGPVKTAQPEVGYMTVEPNGRARDYLLTDLTYPQSSLEFLVRRSGLADGFTAVSPAEVPGSEVYLSLGEALMSFGFLVSHDQLDKLSASVATTKYVADQLSEGIAPEMLPDGTGDLDVTALLWPKTTSEGALVDINIDPKITDRRLKTLARARPDLDLGMLFDTIGDEITLGRMTLKSTECDFVYLSIRGMK